MREYIRTGYSSVSISLAGSQVSSMKPENSSKEKRLFAAWTHKGLVNVKCTGNPKEKPAVIRSLVELSQARNSIPNNNGFCLC